MLQTPSLISAAGSGGSSTNSVEGTVGKGVEPSDFVVGDGSDSNLPPVFRLVVLGADSATPSAFSPDFSLSSPSGGPMSTFKSVFTQLTAPYSAGVKLDTIRSKETPRLQVRITSPLERVARVRIKLCSSTNFTSFSERKPFCMEEAVGVNVQFFPGGRVLTGVTSIGRAGTSKSPYAGCPGVLSLVLASSAVLSLLGVSMSIAS
mmetsp:Transcript_13124/g.28345  ORF Transcript_13124/g.28345 Transcript_13124/m.28345 type:complete len:205 (-) Transcript_13124:9-623(-)